MLKTEKRRYYPERREMSNLILWEIKDSVDAHEVVATVYDAEMAGTLSDMMNNREAFKAAGARV